MRTTELIDADAIVAKVIWENNLGNDSAKNNPSSVRRILGGLSLHEERTLVYAQESNGTATGLIGNLDQRSAAIFSSELPFDYAELLVAGPEGAPELATPGLRVAVSTFSLLCERLRIG